MGCLAIAPVQAQVVPANDSIGTLVLPNGRQITIDGGTASDNGINLFHSFSQFNLNSQETATFLTNPDIQNVLGRIIGGDPSTINGLIELTGSDANLFLMNPAGIIFGADAQLDIPGSFTATTATGIGFDTGWFQAFETNDINTLGSTPTAFAFGSTDPGSLINLGHLSIPTGEALTLVGGTVLNLGTLSAPDGHITIAAVDGHNLVRIQQDGTILALELDTLTPDSELIISDPTAPTPATLPSLLTGGDLASATQLTVTDDGTVQLTPSSSSPGNQPITINADAGSTTLSGQVDASGETGGDIVVVGDRLTLAGADLSVSGEVGAGTIRIGGDLGGQPTLPTATTTWIDASSTIQANTATQGDGGRVIVWADDTTQFEGLIEAEAGEVSGNGGFVEVSGAETLIFRGDVSTAAANGRWGTLLLDPENIIIANGTGAANDNELSTDKEIREADGGGSTFTISEQRLETLATNSDVILEATNDITIHDLTDDGRLSFGETPRSVTFTAGGTVRMVDPTDTIEAPRRIFTIDADRINIGNLDIGSATANGGSVNLSANNGNLTVGNINTSTTGNARDGGTINLTAAGGAIQTGNLDASSRSPSNANFGGIITLTATNGITTGTIDTRSESNATVDNGGAVTLTTTTGNIITEEITTRSFSTGSPSDGGGTVVLQTGNGSISTGTIDTRTESNNEQAGNSGDITLLANNGSIITDDLITRSTANTAADSGLGGTVVLTAGQDITTRTIDTRSQGDNSSAAGQLTITAGNRLSLGAVDVRGEGTSGTSGHLAFQAHEIDFTGGPNSVFGGSWTISLPDTSPDINIGIDTDAGPGILDLTTTDLRAIGDSFTNITIQPYSGTETITIYEAATDTGTAPLQAPIILNGGSTLVGPDIDTTWDITESNGGNLDSLFNNGFSFNNIENLASGTGNDTFIFTNGNTVSGSIQDQGGTDTFDYSTDPTSRVITLSSLPDIETFIGGPGFNNLQAEDTDNAWTISGPNSGTVNGITFSNFANLIGGNLTDTFTLAPTGSVLTLNGGSGINTLTGADGINNWAIIGANQGSVTGVPSFNNIQNVIGGSQSDNFLITGAGDLSGTIDGGSGSDILNYSSYGANPIQVALDGTLTGASGFSNIEQVIGNTASTEDTITGSSGNDNFDINSPGNLSVAGITFSGFENLNGAAGDDTFRFTNNSASIIGNIEGGSGANSLDYSGYSTDIRIDLENAIATGITGTFNNIDAIAGGTSTNDQVLGTSTPDTFTITATNIINAASGIRLSDIESINGLGGNDTFIFDGGTVANVDGGLGADILTGDDIPNTWAIASLNAGTLNGTTFRNFDNLTGGADTDTFQLQGGSVNGTIDGGLGSDRVEGTPGNDTVAISSPNAATINGTTFINIDSFDGQTGTDELQGTVGNDTITITGSNAVTSQDIDLSNIDTLDGAEGSDRFVFNDGVTFAGNIDGNGGSDTLDYSSFTNTLSINVDSLGATNVETLIGTTNADSTIIGPNAVNTWTITAQNQGSINGINFTDFQNLTGSFSTDTFIFSDGAEVTGLIDGREAADTFDYSAYTTPVSLDISPIPQVGTGSSNFQNIDIFLGGSASDFITATNGDDTLTLTGTDTGGIAWLTFDGFENINTGAGNDLIVIPEGTQLSGTLDGGSGTDRLDYSASTTPVTINLDSNDTTGINRFSNLEMIQGSSSTLDTLQGTSSNDTIEITGNNSGVFNTITFNGIENLEGQAGNDQFTINGGTLNSINGGTGTDTINADAIANSWIITGPESGTLNGITLNTVETLIGNSNTDQFQFADGVRFDGTIDGGANTDTLDFSNYTTDPMVDLASLGANQVETVVGSTLSPTSTLQGSNTVNTWDLSGNDAGTINGTTQYSQFNTLMGGNTSDTFQLNGGAISGNIDGGLGNDIVQGTVGDDRVAIAAPNAATINGASFINIESFEGQTGTDTLQGTVENDTIIITGANSATSQGISASNIETIDGDAGDDEFIINNGITFAGSIDGNSGSNTLDYSTFTDELTVDLSSLSATNIQTLIGTTNADSTLIGPNAVNSWTITNLNQGTIQGITFSNFQNLTGAFTTDTFTFKDGARITGRINGASGTDSLDYSDYTTPIAIDLGPQSATGTDSIRNIDVIIGTNGVDTLTATANDDTLTLTGADAGTVAWLTFDGIESVNTGAGDDHIIIPDGTQLSGSLDGGSGSDRLDYSSATGPLTLDLEHQTSNSIGGTFSNLEAVTGSGSTGDRILGSNQTDTITLTNNDTGTIQNENLTLAFSNIENIEGQDGDDTVIFNNGASITGTLDGGLGRDRLDYSDYTTAITIDLADQSATATGGWQNQDVIIGGSVSDTIQGTTGNDQISITGNYSGQWQDDADQNLAFEGIESLNAGLGDDTFEINGGTVDRIDGDLGTNTLIGDNSENNWQINQINGGSLNTLSFENIQNLTGSDQADRITFSDNGAIDGRINGNDGALTLTGDNIILGASVTGSGSLTIEPLSANQDIRLGGTRDTSNSALILSSAELSALDDGFTQITIGRSDSSGQITLDAPIQVSDPLRIQSPTGTGSIDTAGFSITGTDNASLELRAATSVTTGPLHTEGQSVTITAASIETGDIETQADNTPTAMGGDIRLTSDSTIVTGDLNASGSTRGGDITLTGGNTSTTAIPNNTRRPSSPTSRPLARTPIAGTSVLTGAIAAQSAIGNGGNITIVGSESIQVASINSEAGLEGGTIDISTDGFFLTTSQFQAANGQSASISNIGGTEQATITIRHGGNSITPFSIGGNSSSDNGSASSITNGTSQFAQGESFLGSITRGNVHLITQDRDSNPSTSLTPPTILTPNPSPTTPSIPAPSIPDSNPDSIESPPLENDTVEFQTDFDQEVLVGLPTHNATETNMTDLVDQAYPLEVEIAFTRQFQNHLGIPGNEAIEIQTIAQTKTALQEVERTTDLTPALLYVFFVPSPSLAPGNTGSNATQDISLIQYSDDETRDRSHDTLELVLVTGQGDPIRHHFWDVTRKDVETMVGDLQSQVTRLHAGPRQYLPPAQALYRQLISPLESDLETLDINSLTFILDSGLRSIPMAALHDGDQFLVENYSISIMPSFSLIDTNRTVLHDMQVLAMGASEFTEQSALPAVPQELSAITQEIWEGDAFLNEDFTTENLNQQRSQDNYGIVHLATHANFVEGDLENSYIQFWDQRLSLDEMVSLNLHEPMVALLVLSACNTALGNEDAELGFAGLSVQAGAASALASLWAVSDDGTLAFMTEFYQQLQDHATKVESLRQAQIEMISGDLWVDNGLLVYSDGRTTPLPEEYEGAGSWSLNHPLYWSAFTLIGNPW